MVPPSDLSEGDEVDGILKAWRSLLPRADLTPLSSTFSVLPSFPPRSSP